MLAPRRVLGAYRSMRQSLCPQISRLRTQWTRSLATAAGGDSNTWDVGIVGGGITGLTTAYYLQTAINEYNASPLSQKKLRANLTLYESSNELGGWMNTETVKVGDKGEYIRLEKGPRTIIAGLRSVAFLDLVRGHRNVLAIVS